MNPTSDDLLKMLNKALGNLFIRDHHLLQVEASERSITHKLGEYLRLYLDDRLDQSLNSEPRISVDCEYNRFGTQGLPKRLPLYTDLLINDEPYYLVNPDIVIHHRGPQSDNWLVIEVKTFFNHRPAVVLLDKLKLVGYLGHPTYYNSGVFLDLGYSEGSPKLLEAKLVQKAIVKAMADKEVEIDQTMVNAHNYYWNQCAGVVFTKEGNQIKVTTENDNAAAKLMKGLEEAFGFIPIF